MTRLRLALNVAVSVVSSGTLVQAQNNLVITPDVVESRYCSQPDGTVTFDVNVRFTYRNKGRTTIILPFATLLSAYALFRDELDLKADRSEDRVTFHDQPRFDSSKLDTSRPEPRLFEFLPPGGIAHRLLQVSIFLQSRKVSSSNLLGKSHLLRLTLDNWPDSRRDEKKFRSLWGPYGLLWAGIDELILRISIENSPVAKHCAARVD